MIGLLNLRETFCVRGQFPKIVLMGLVVLLAVQLTGLSCLSDFGLHSSQGVLLSQSMAASSVSGLESTADGCPCHLLFHTVSGVLTSVVSPFIATYAERPPVAVLVLSRDLFRPPSLT